MPIQFDFGTAVRHRRDVLRLSQMEVAAKLGMSDANYGNIERGKQSPSLEQVEKIAEALDTTVGELLGITNTTNIAHQPTQSSVGNYHTVTHQYHNEEQARQADRLFALLQEQNQTLAQLVEVLAKSGE